MDNNETDKTPIVGTPTQISNCSQFEEGGSGQEPDVLVTPYPDDDGDGIPDLYLTQSDDNPCFSMGGDETSAVNAEIDWQNMTTSVTGCKDVTPVDIGRHYATEPSAPPCL